MWDYSKVGVVGGCWTGEVRDGQTSPYLDHKIFSHGRLFSPLQANKVTRLRQNPQKFSTLWVKSKGRINYNLPSLHVLCRLYILGHWACHTHASWVSFNAVILAPIFSAQYSTNCLPYQILITAGLYVTCLHVISDKSVTSTWRLIAQLYQQSGVSALFAGNVKKKSLNPFTPTHRSLRCVTSYLLAGGRG